MCKVSLCGTPSLYVPSYRHLFPTTTTSLSINRAPPPVHLCHYMERGVFWQGFPLRSPLLSHSPFFVVLYTQSRHVTSRCLYPPSIDTHRADTLTTLELAVVTTLGRLWPSSSPELAPVPGCDWMLTMAVVTCC